jgi:hypothetical protein
MRNLLILLLILASFSVLVGVLAKVQHWPGADILLGAGLITELFCAALLVLHFWKGRTR